MRRETEVAIVGAGIMGLAAARALAAAGRSVTLLEQFRVGHARGSSHGTSRIFRIVYDNPHFVQLAQAALPLWRAAERETGATLVTTTTSVDVGDDLAPFGAALDQADAVYELVDGAEVNRRHPRLRLGTDRPCLVQPDGGIVHADGALRAFRDAALAGGAELREETPVRRLEEEPDAVRVELDGVELRAQSVVVAAGPWSNRLLQPLGLDVELEPTRETVAYVRFDGADELPTVIDRAAGVARETLPRPVDEVYALAAPGVGLKVGVHKAGGATDPDQDVGADDATVSAELGWLSRTYDLPAPELISAETCVYTNTDDSGFVVERRGRIVVAAACSGHGFKFAPEIGRRLAELAIESLA